MADALRHLVIDGSNIATEGRSLPSLAQLDEAVRALVKERPYQTWTVVVDATFGHRIDASEKQVYEEALAANELVTPPAGTIGRGDKFLLEIADRAGATVFSNDSFQEFHGEYDWLFDEGRLIGGKPVPEVGWIFTERTPVRGPKSRMSSRAAERRGRVSASGDSRTPRRVLSATGPPPVPTKPPPRLPRREPVRAARTTPLRSTTAASAEVEPVTLADNEPARGRRTSSSSPEPVNDPLPFIQFIAEHRPGQEVEGEVLTFTSHGAFVQVGDVRCYLALKHMGDPAPRSARDVLQRGDTVRFVVQAIDAPRRGIDLALPGFEDIDEDRSTTVAGPDAVEEVPAAPARRSRSRRVAPVAPPEEAPAEEAPSDEADVVRRREPSATDRPTRLRRTRAAAPVPQAQDDAMTVEASPDETVKVASPRKRGARSVSAESTTPTVSEKAPAEPTAAKKAPAKKAPAKKAPAKKAPAKKAPTKKAPAKKAPTKKAPAKKAPTKKAPTKKAPTKKAPAKKAPAKKAPAKKAPAKKVSPSTAADMSSSSAEGS
jgi:hypothetical protein